MADHMPPDLLLQAVNQLRSAMTGRDVIAYWYQVLADRGEYAGAMSRLAAGSSVVPLVVRGGFDNYNSVTNDLLDLIVAHRKHFEPPTFSGGSVNLPVALVLIAKTEFELPGTDSPAALPDWFPVRGGEIVKIRIEDLRWKAVVPVDADEVRGDEVCERIYDIETALTRRWRAARRHEPVAGNSFFSRVCPTPPPVTADDLLTRAEAFHSTITVHSGFRPRAKPDTPSLVGLILRLANQTSRDELLSRARELAGALCLPPTSLAPADSLITVLNRSGNSVPEQPTRFARNLILTVNAASQLVNAGAHKDCVPEFPVVFLQGLSLNLRERLADLAHCLNTWPIHV